MTIGGNASDETAPEATVPSQAADGGSPPAAPEAAASPETGAPETAAGQAEDGTGQRRAVRKRRRGLLVAGAVVLILGVELVVGGRSLAGALAQLQAPHWDWVALGVLAEIASMGVFARMQRRLLRSAGTEVHLVRHVAVAYAAHSLSVTLPGGPVFSTSFNFQQMRRFGASAAVASWCVVLSGVLSTGALIVIGLVGGVLSRQGVDAASVVMYLLVALALALAIRVLTLHPEWLSGLADGLLAVVNRVRRRPASTGSGQLRAMIDQIWSVRIKPTDFAVAALHAVANWLFDAMCLWICCIAVDAGQITVSRLVIAYAAGMAAAGITVIPGGLGVVDGALIVGLVAGGLPASGAIAAVLLYRIISFGFIAAAGWVFWLLIRRHVKRGTPTRLLVGPRPRLARLGWYARSAQWRVDPYEPDSTYEAERVD